MKAYFTMIFRALVASNLIKFVIRLGGKMSNQKLKINILKQIVVIGENNSDWKNVEKKKFTRNFGQQENLLVYSIFPEQASICVTKLNAEEKRKNYGKGLDENLVKKKRLEINKHNIHQATTNDNNNEYFYDFFIFINDKKRNFTPNSACYKECLVKPQTQGVDFE
ncbi:hypothetical protein BpHYR1_030876 [Brachionus plicatilis]|uniref:Uncharacterized protein n=1 Tax=Brachionus plicatilis TaxID=10195 RepID=A0A3M7QIM5_BRAPC|nr:hypothetical protein BpHYR1_030876 [Brachionus plicatilis]